MISNISYQMDIDDIKNEVRQNYMRVAGGYVMSGEYKQNRKKRIFKILRYCFLYFLLNLLLYKKGLSTGDYTSNLSVLAICMTIIFPAFLIPIIYVQNNNFKQDLKKLCTKEILKDLANIKYIDEKEVQSAPDTLTQQDISDLTNENHKTFYKKEAFIGEYQDINYSLNEIKLFSNETKRLVTFTGCVMKATANTNLNGWVNVENKKNIEKPVTFMPLFLMYLFMDITFTTIFFVSIDCLNKLKFIYIGVIIFFAIVSYVMAKVSVKDSTQKANNVKRHLRKSALIDINQEVTITASDGIQNVDDFVTTELIDAIDTLKMLFDTNEISCKFFADKILLAINSYKNLFELGGLFSSPLNKKVSEKFISQISGILLFLDYISINFEVKQD